VAIVLPKLSRRRPPTGPAAETQPAVRLSLCNEEGIYKSGSSLRACWGITRVPVDEIQCIEISVLWHTEGKGDEDLHVHHFHRITEAHVRRSGIAAESSIECVLPATPLSYRGRLINLCWCVRLRLYLTGGREIVTEQPFYLVSAEMHLPCSAEASQESSVAEDQLEEQPEASLSSRSRQLVGHATRS